MKSTLILTLILASITTGFATPIGTDNDEAEKKVFSQSAYGITFLDDDVADDDDAEVVHIQARTKRS